MSSLYSVMIEFTDLLTLLRDMLSLSGDFDGLSFNHLPFPGLSAQMEDGRRIWTFSRVHC